MFGITTVFMACVALISTAAPPYRQSMDSFTTVKTYVLESLGPLSGDFTVPAARKQMSFGILAGVLSALVQARANSSDYEPLQVVNENVPCSWNNYNAISSETESTLVEAAQKVQVIDDLMTALCDKGGVEECNAQVDAKVKQNPNTYSKSAVLLIQLGKVSNTIKSMQSTLHNVTSTRHEIPYLIDNVETDAFKSLVEDVGKAHEEMQQMQFRRSNLSP